MCADAIWSNQCSSHSPAFNGNLFGEMHLKWCIIYLDDIIVFSRMPEEHIERLRGMFTKLVAAGLRLKLSKCKFFKSQVTYLGHIVSKKWHQNRY